MFLSCRAWQTQHPQQASCSYPSLYKSIKHYWLQRLFPGHSRRNHRALDFCCKATTFWTPFFLRNLPNSGLDIMGTHCSRSCLQLPASSNSMNFKTKGTHQVTEQQTCFHMPKKATGWLLVVKQSCCNSRGWANESGIGVLFEEQLFFHVQKEGMLKMPVILHSFWTVKRCLYFRHRKTEGQKLTPPWL